MDLPDSPPAWCASLFIKIAPADVAMFRFLLEARENLAYFTVLERKTALLKIVFAPESKVEVEKALTEIGQSLKITLG